MADVVLGLRGRRIGRWTVWYLFARDTPAEHPGVSRAEFEHIQAGLTIAASNPSAQGGQRTNLVRWGTVLKSKEVLAITFSYFCFGYVAWIFFSWFFIYLARVRGLNLKSSAFYSMLPPLAMAICSILGGALSDRLTRWKGARIGRCIVPAAAIFLAAGFLSFGSMLKARASRAWSSLEAPERFTWPRVLSGR